MITPHQLKEGQVLCKAIAKYRAMGRCEMPHCGKEATDGHHVFFGRRWRAYWQLLLNENYYIALCEYNHRFAPFAPHVDDYQFWGMIKEGMTRIDPERVAILLEQQSRLYTQRWLSDRQCDGKAELKRLRSEFRRWQAIYEMDIEAVQVPPGRLI